MIVEYGLNINGLDFSFADKKILKNIDMSIKPGAFVSIIGPNGSGKTTLLKNISTYLKPQEGIIYIGNQNINELSRKEISKIMSVVPQNTSMEFDYKVKDIVMMGRHPYVQRFKRETLEDAEIIEKTMRYTNTIGLSDSSFNELSGGEKQRVILAQALAQSPSILLLDEPVSHLDLQHQIEILDLIKRMSIKDSLTVITVLHDLNMASVYSDYMLMLKEGRIFKEGEPEEVLTQNNIKDVFNINVVISNNPVTSRPYIYTLSSIPKPKRKLKIHIICGGGSGTHMIRVLLNKGFKVSAGVLNIGDSDWAVSKEYQLDLAEEIPFLDISDSAYRKNIELASRADLILFMPVYFSDRNIKNIEVLLEKELKDKTIYICNGDNFNERDFSGGRARKLYKQLKEKDKVFLIDERDILDLLIGLDDKYE